MRITALMWLAVEAVDRVGGAYAVFEQAHPYIVSGLSQVFGRIMPEYFWDAVREKDRIRMADEMAAARRKSTQIEIRYSNYSPTVKIAIEKAYREVLGALDSSRHEA